MHLRAGLVAGGQRWSVEWSCHWWVTGNLKECDTVDETVAVVIAVFVGNTIDVMADVGTNDGWKVKSVANYKQDFHIELIVDISGDLAFLSVWCVARFYLDWTLAVGETMVGVSVEAMLVIETNCYCHWCCTTMAHHMIWTGDYRTAGFRTWLVRYLLTSAFTL